MTRFALLALALIATPASANEIHLSGMAEAVIGSEWADPIAVDDYLFNPLRFDQASTSVLLDASTLPEVASRLGGTIQTEDIFDNLPVSWLCYDTPRGRTTFAALRTGIGMQNDQFEPVANLIIEEMNPPTANGCSRSDKAVDPQPGNDLPTLGATRADLEARFPTAAHAGDSIAIVTAYLQGDDEPWTERKVIYYRLENDIVTGIAYKLTTDVAFGGFIERAVTGRFASTGEFEPRNTPRVGLIKAGALHIELEVTPMQALIDAYGGTINEQGEAGGHVKWICYALPGATVWFYSDGEMGDGKVTAIAGEAGFPRVSWGCSLAPHTLRYVHLDVPGIQAPLTELETPFQSVQPDDENRFGITTESPHPAGNSVVIVQDVVYRLDGDDKVDAIAVVQITGD